MNNIEGKDNSANLIACVIILIALDLFREYLKKGEKTDD